MYKYKPKNKKWSKLGSLVAEAANAVKQEGTQLQQHIASKPPAYHSKYQDQLDNIVSELEDRSSFHYNINGDAFFQRYKDAYIQNGMMAMKDTTGQAAVLTGGYGSSYAQKVGQQTYQGYLQRLDDVIPELYQLAVEKYNHDTSRLQERYILYSDLDARDYSRWQESQDEYYAKLQQLTENTRDQVKQDDRHNVSKNETKPKESETPVEEKSTKLAKYQFIGVDDNGKYRYSLGGKQYVYVKGTNPHTGTVNEDIANGTFGRSGYQPDNIGGKKLTWSGQYGIMNGHEQKIWMKPDGTLWMWDDTVNSYVPHDDYVEVDTDATRSFRASVLRKNEFRRTNGQNNRPASYNDYLEETIDQWLGKDLLNDTEAATLLIQYGLISKGNSQVPTQKNSADRQNGSGKQSSARRSERLEKIKGKLLNGDFCADMTVEDVMAFVSDAQTFMEESANAYSNLTWEQATSADYEAKRKKRSEDLTGRATQVRTFLNANKENINPEAYENYMQYLTDFATFQTRSSQDFEKAYRSYSEFETREAYDQALRTYNQMIAWEQKYSGMNHDELKDAISKLEDGAEKEWLASYTTSQMTHQDYTMDIAIAEWDLYRMENELEEFDYLSRWELTEEEKVREEQYRNKYGTVQDLKRLIEEKKEYIWDLEKGQKYNLLSENEDYAYLSTKVADEPTAGWGVSAWGKWYGQGDEIYDYVNDIDGSRERIRIGGDSNNGDAMYYHLSFMSEDEISKYNYLYNTSGRDAANEYLDYLKYDLNKRRQAKIAGDTQKFAIEHPDLADLYSIVANLASGIGLIDIAGQNAVKGIKEAVTGEYAGPIDYHTPAMNPNTISTSIRYTRAQTLANKYGVININEDDHPLWASIFNGKSLGDVYQLGMSMADSAAVLAMSPLIGPYGVVLLGGSAGTQGVLNALENGATDEQALAMGTLNGFFEMFFEKYSLETLLSSGGRKFADALWRNAVAEGSEEFFTSAANNISDILIMAEKSGYMRNVKAYIEDGYSESGAMQKAFLDMGIDLGWDFLGGFISGAIMGGGKLATNTVQQLQYAKTGKEIKATDGGVDTLMNSANEIKAKSSEDVQKTLNEQMDQVTQNPSARNVGRLAETVRAAGNQIKTSVGPSQDAVRTATNQTNTPIDPAEVTHTLRTKGISERQAGGIAEAIVARLNGQQLTNTQRSVLSFELGRPSVQKVINDLIQKKIRGIDSAQSNVYDKDDVVDGLENREEATLWDIAKQRVGADRSGVLGMLREIDSLSPEAFSAAQRRGLTSEVDVFGDNDYATVMGGSSLYQVRNAFSKRNYESGTDVLDEIKRTGEIVVEFNYNSKYDKIEFARQLADQQKGMKELTVQEYLDNRRKYIEQGRATGSNAAQQAAREKAFADKVDELQDAGLSLKEAEEQAKKWLDTQAALHIPDQVAGGYSGNVGGVGDKGVNSSIGAQWRYRISGVDAQIQKMAESMSEAEKNTTYLNVKLIFKGE